MVADTNSQRLPIMPIDVWIDDLTPCLKDNSTGELVETEVIRIRRKSFLSKYNKFQRVVHQLGNTGERQ